MSRLIDPHTIIWITIAYVAVLFVLRQYRLALRRIEVDRNLAAWTGRWVSRGKFDRRILRARIWLVVDLLVVIAAVAYCAYSAFTAAPDDAPPLPTQQGTEQNAARTY